MAPPAGMGRLFAEALEDRLLGSPDRGRQEGAEAETGASRGGENESPCPLGRGGCQAAKPNERGEANMAESTGDKPNKKKRGQKTDNLKSAFEVLAGGQSLLVDFIAQQASVVASVFAHAGGENAAAREASLAAIHSVGILTPENIGVAIGAALCEGNIPALKTAVALSPIKLGRAQIHYRGEVWTFARLAFVLSDQRKRGAGDMLLAAVDLGADLWAKDDEGEDAFRQLIAGADADAIRWALALAPDQKAAVRAKSPEMASGCQLSIFCDKAGVLAALLEAGADPNEVDEEDESKNSLLTLAAAMGKTACAKALLDAGARIDHQNKDGASALIRAAAGPHLGVCELLLGRGANASLQTTLGESALSMAIVTKNKALVELLAPLTDPKQTNLAGETALEQAIAAEFWPGVDALSERAGEEAAFAALTAFARKKLPKTTRVVERGQLRAAAEHGQRNVATTAAGADAGGSANRKRPKRRI
jgi:hypothetical protein